MLIRLLSTYIILKGRDIMKKRLLILWVSLVTFLCISLIAYQKLHNEPSTPVLSYSDGTIIVEETHASNVPVEDWNTISSSANPQSEPESEPAFTEYDIQLMAIGDNLLHMGLVNSGKQADGSLNYDFLFTEISEYLNRSDIKIINQETPLAGNSRGFSGYPNFNSPTEVGDAIAKAGFNVVLSATNHSADQGIDGIDSIVSYWNNHPEILLAGLHAPVDETLDTNPRIHLLTIKEKTFAILNYTYGPNYGSAPTKLAQRMDILCNIDPGSKVIDFTTINPTVLEDIAEAKSMADIVIVCPHWGTEYALEPSSYQRSFAIDMTEAGADVIIGTHPHVPQPIEVVTSPNGNTSLCYYSLGNYVSTQQNGPSMLEELAWVSFHVTENDITVDFEKSGALPIVCHYYSGPLRFGNIYALEDYTEELASRHGIIQWGNIPFHLADLEKWSQQVLGDRALKKTDCLGE